jgi:hypothetical protein
MRAETKSDRAHRYPSRYSSVWLSCTSDVVSRTSDTPVRVMIRLQDRTAECRVSRLSCSRSSRPDGDVTLMDEWEPARVHRQNVGVRHEQSLRPCFGPYESSAAAVSECPESMRLSVASHATQRRLVRHERRLTRYWTCVEAPLAADVCISEHPPNLGSLADEVASIDVSFSRYRTHGRVVRLRCCMRSDASQGERISWIEQRPSFCWSKTTNSIG